MRGYASGIVKSCAAALLVAASLPVTAFADKRVALVIGNSAYEKVAPLDNPKHDATLIADTLRALGFTLVGGGAQLDLDKPSLDRAVQSFGDQMQGADVGLFYYAGHGVELHGANYLVPVDAYPSREADVNFQMLDTELVLQEMADARTKLNLIILDACRTNPFVASNLRAMGGGLAQMQAPEGTLISFATQPRHVALDGKDGDSPYTKALAETIRRPGLDIFRTFNEVGLQVMDVTGNEQQPWLSTSPIRGDFYFSRTSVPDEPMAPGAPSAAALEAANELFALISTDLVEQLMAQMSNAFWPLIDQKVRAANIDDDTIGELHKEFDRIQIKFVTQAMEQAPPIYARHFNVGELHDLAAFYRTPTGAKTLRELPQVMGEFTAPLMPHLQEVQDQTGEAFDRVLREHGYIK